MLGLDEHLGDRPYVSVIVCPALEMGWTTPLFFGYLTHENNHGVVVCEQATVIAGA